MNTTKRQYDSAVYIGRFQPPHAGHIWSIRKGLELADRLIIVIGTANAPRTIKNPFSDHEREQMILISLTPAEQARVDFVFIQDRYYQNKYWISDVGSACERQMERHGWKDQRKVVLIGFEKDDTSWYLNSFPQWDFYEVKGHSNDPEANKYYSSTEVRELMFRGMLDYTKYVINEDVFIFLKQFTKSSEFDRLEQEYQSALQEEKIYSGLPEERSVNSFTADAVVFQSGHILLIRRGRAPGKGLWALPGGHIGRNEFSLDAAVRELTEETRIKVTEKVLRGSIKGEKVFEHPDRSLRHRVPNVIGRTVTWAYCFVLADNHKLPRVTGADDAAEAWWFPLGEFRRMRNQLFEDHYDIANYFLDQVQ